MKKIGILTYHRSINYGAFMQSYSLCKRLSDDFPDCRVEIIDYLPVRKYLLYNKNLINYIKLILYAKGIREKITYTKFMLKSLCERKRVNEEKKMISGFKNQLKSLNLSDYFIISDNDDEVFEKIRNAKYDVVIVGSDAVFNWDLCKFPNPYFLHDDIGCKKMSYAASSYGLDYSKISEYQREYLCEAWKTFNYVGVRDIPTEMFVKHINSGITVHHNCDPTVFLNVNSLPIPVVKIKNILIEKGINFSKPIIGIMCDDWLGKIVKDSIGDKYNIVSVYKANKYADCFLEDLSPFEWSIVFSLFDVTFTHFFHGNLLSLKNGTPTIAIEKRNQYNIEYNSKIRDFMERVDLLDFCFYEDEVNIDEISKRVDNIISDAGEYKNRIKCGIDRESEYYYSFRDTLLHLLNK